eukprot:5838_1
MSLLAICILVYIYKCNADLECTYSWIDGTSVDENFTPYDSTYNEPQIVDEFGCVVIDWTSGGFKWTERDCTDELPFICNKCNEEGPRHIIDYEVPSDDTEYMALNWNDANIYCQDDCNSHLASIHDPQQYEFIQNMFKQETAHFDTVWIGLYRDCEYEITTSITNERNENVSEKFLGMPAQTGIALLVISLTVAACILCAIGWLCYSKQKKQNKEMQKQMAAIQKKLSALEEVKTTQKPNDESPGSVHSNGFPITKTSERVLSGVDEEGNGNIEMQEGVQQEGHTKITKIESAVHLEVLPGDEYNNDDEEEDVMLSDDMADPKDIYNLIKEIGSGEFGTVWKAQNKKTKKIVA